MFTHVKLMFKLNFCKIYILSSSIMSTLDIFLYAKYYILMIKRYFVGVNHIYGILYSLIFIYLIY